MCGSDLLLLAIASFLHLVYDQLRITFQPFVRQLLLSILELLVGMFAYVAAQDIPRDAFFPWETWWSMTFLANISLIWQDGFGQDADLLVFHFYDCVSNRMEALMSWDLLPFELLGNCFISSFRLGTPAGFLLSFWSSVIFGDFLWEHFFSIILI